MRRSARERLARRARYCLGVAIAGWVVFAACLLDPTSPLTLMFVAFLAVPAAILTLVFALRCPACRARIPQIALAAAWPGGATQTQRCPACQSDLDRLH
jgi:hypothetical protein